MNTPSLPYYLVTNFLLKNGVILLFFVFFIKYSFLRPAKCQKCFFPSDHPDQRSTKYFNGTKAG